MEIFWVLVLIVLLFAGILSGVQVMITIAGVPFFLALIASFFGAFDLGFLSAFPHRIIGVMNNPLLIAIPLFVLMGNLLEQSKQAENMLFSITKLLGETRSTLAIAVIVVSTLIAASTGIIGATIVMLGMIALPALLNAGVPKQTSAGLICASGALGQIIPPSIVLILLGDQISNAYIEAQQAIGNFAPEPVSVGDLFAGALIPGMVLVSLYTLYVVVKLLLSEKHFVTTPNAPAKPALSTRQIFGLIAQILPTALLILAVLGSILVGVATPTEAAAIGVAGTTLIAAYNSDGSNRFLKPLYIVTAALAAVAVVMQRMGWSKIDYSSTTVSLTIENQLAIGVALILAMGLMTALIHLWRSGMLRGAVANTCQISAMIFGIIIAASMLSLVFRGFGGDVMVENLLTSLPGNQWTMLFVTMAVIFVLGFILDFVEIIFIVIPIIGPVILQADFHPVWFAVLIALNIQTSFLTPPFGFALFYFRSVAPPEISTKDIYSSIIPFVILQIITLGLVVALPDLATWLPDLLFR